MNKTRSEKKSNWDDVFSENIIDRRKIIWRRSVIISCFILICIVVVQCFFIKSGESVLQRVIEICVVPIITAILSGAFLNIVYTESENSQLKEVKNFEYKELARDFFEILDKSGGKKRFNERIDVTLSRYCEEEKIEKFLNIKIAYEFETNILDNKLRFMFVRNPSGDISSYLSSYNASLMGYEFYWANDESGTFDKSIIKDDDYKIENVSVNSIPRTEFNIYKSNATAEGNIIVYEIDISDVLNNKKSTEELYKLALEVSFPMEIESILCITHEYPTKSSEVSVNYSQIAQDITVYTMPITGPIPVNDQHITNTHCNQYRYSGWLIPKTGYIISWWKNEKSN